LDELVDDSRKEDYNFVRRLRDEFLTGYNKFDQQGECLYLAHLGKRVIGSCGMNRDPYITDKNYGRVRHLYVLQDYRNRGIASRLLELVMEEGKKTFDTLTLRTFNDSASNLYIKHGFIKNDVIPYATHHMEVRRRR
jgi:ribosomal protein S18 acetylase RimI-like enzyme